MDVFKIDGKSYPHIHVTSIKRSGEVLDGPNTERTMHGDMKRDLIGSYYNYSVVIDSEDSSPEEYDALYEVLTAPQESHDMVMPYGQTTLTFKAYVTHTDDELQYIYDENLRRWGDLTFNMVAMSPARRPRK